MGKRIRCGRIYLFSVLERRDSRMTKKQIVLSICTLVLVCMSLLTASNILKVKDSDIKYESFYEKKEDFDVLFYGSSIVHYGILPMELWKEYGITSYNMGNNSERLYMTYHTLKNSLDYASPEMIVVDLGGLGWAGQKVDGTLKDHGFLDSVPLSYNKIKSVYELFDEGRRLEFLLPSVVYHSRWEELSENDFAVPKSYTYGADILTHVERLEKPTQERYEESRDAELEIERETLLRIKALCEERGIRLLLVFMPYEVRGGDQKLREEAREFALENDILYYDFQEAEAVDWESGFGDESHMNYQGAQKFTNYLGELLRNEYQIDSHKEEAGYEDWDADYQEYADYCSRLVME